jgi:hypothetical protein
VARFLRRVGRWEFSSRMFSRLWRRCSTLGRTRRMARELIRDRAPWRCATPVAGLAQEGLGRLPVPARLDEDVEPRAILVDGAPQPIATPIRLEVHIVNVPLVPGLGRRRLSPAAKGAPNSQHHKRTVSDVSVPPRSAINSSASRGPKPKRR